MQKCGKLSLNPQIPSLSILLSSPSCNPKACSLIVIWVKASQNRQNDMCPQRRFRLAWASAYPVWSESLLSTWRSLGSLSVLKAHIEDTDQTGWMPRLIWVFTGRTSHSVGFVVLWFNFPSCIFQIRLEAVARLHSPVEISTRSMWRSSWAQGNAAISPHITEHLLYTSGIR